MSYPRVFALHKPKLTFTILGVFMAIISSFIYPVYSILCEPDMKENGNSFQGRNLKYSIISETVYLKIVSYIIKICNTYVIHIH